MTDGQLSFPRQYARTQRFTLGRPRAVTVAPDGETVLFVRARAGDDPVHDLWRLDLTTGAETVVAATATLPLTTDGGDLPPAERARRERLREGGAGIVAYASSRDGATVCFAVGGEVFVADVHGGDVLSVPLPGPGFDPRLSPDGTRLAVSVGDDLLVVVVGAADDEPLRVSEDGVSWGRAEFVAAEEMGRSRGHWWVDGGAALLVARVDERSVPRWHIADPANPGEEPVVHAYPAAGTTNADVSLWRVALDGDRTEVVWDRKAMPYLATVVAGPRPLLQVQTRDQRRVEVLELTADGTVEQVAAWEDDDWVELVPGTPCRAGSRLVTVRDLADHGDGGSRALLLDDEVVTPAGWQVMQVVDADERRVVALVQTDDPLGLDVVHVPTDGSAPSVVTTRDGVHAASSSGDVDVVVAANMFQDTPSTEVRRAGQPLARIGAVAERSGIVPDVRLLELGPDRLFAGLLLPRREVDPGGPLPVLLDPYGGPHARRVVASRGAWLLPQWLADQGFAVLVADGRGTPGKGPRFERAVHHDLAIHALADQVAALDAAAVEEPRLDLDRVGIRGWSFGGFLAALAVLRRPDRFHAAVVGAPVTDWRLYDTHYTERYLGHPDEHPDAYRVSSLVDEEGRLVGAVEPPGRMPGMLVVHGLADDNVVAAHSLRLSSALLAAGRPHEFLPLSGVTHMTPQEVVAESLLHHQVDFLDRHLRRD